MFLKATPKNILAGGACIACATVAQAQYTPDTTWEGDVSTNAHSSGNWSDGTPGRDVYAVFDDPTGVFQPELPASSGRLQVNGVIFNQAGWSITVQPDPATDHVSIWNNSGNGAVIISNGAGTNFIGAVETKSSTDVTVGTGNTLIIDRAQNTTLRFPTFSGNGTLIVNGDMAEFPLLSGSGNFYLNGDISNNSSGFSRDIASGSIIGGIGSISQTNGGSGYVFQSGSTFAPGARGVDDTGADTFTLFMNREDPSRNNSYLMESGSTMAFELFGDGSSDTLALTGISTLSNVNLTIESNVTLALTGTIVGSTYTLLTADGAGTFTGTFDSVTYDGAPLTEGDDYTITYNPHNAFDPGSGSIDITLTIPEPQTYAMLGLIGVAVLVIRQRRRR